MSKDDTEIVKELNESYERMREQLGKVIVGQQTVVEEILIAVFCRGHALLVGVPGLAKTLLVVVVSVADTPAIQMPSKMSSAIQKK